MNTRGAYERVFLGIAITVTAIWAIGTMVQIIIPTRAVPEYANFIMMTVAGAFFGGTIISSRRRNEGNNSKNDEDDENDPYYGPGGYFRAGK